MGCYKPLQAVYSAVELTRNGKRKIVFSKVRAELFAKGVVFERPDSLQLPCGRCIGCRLERSRQWALRCMHEASLYDKNCFITCTYDNEHLPEGGSLVLRDFQLFIKRLRKRFGDGIRFFHCGEYGEKFSRPHYHACLFNFDFPDKKVYSRGRDHCLFSSDLADQIWGKGFVRIGSVTFDSAAYVARYIMKKITGDEAAAHYCGRMPEYTTMSRRPGLAAAWYEKYSKEVYVTDSVVVKGREVPPPRFYDRRYEIDNAEHFASVKEARIARAKKKPEEATFKRLREKEKCKELQVKNLFRKFEQGE